MTFEFMSLYRDFFSTYRGVLQYQVREDVLWARLGPGHDWFRSKHSLTLGFK